MGGRDARPHTNQTLSRSAAGMGATGAVRRAEKSRAQEVVAAGAQAEVLDAKARPARDSGRLENTGHTRGRKLWRAR